MQMVVINHVYPVGDILPHNTNGESCPCCPVIKAHDGEGGVIVIHNAFDGREWESDWKGMLNPKLN